MRAVARLQKNINKTSLNIYLLHKLFIPLIVELDDVEDTLEII
jgi:hypothetical protein